MNLRDLQYLVAVADVRNFSQAADKCFVSQPTLSNQIRKLEETLGITLFERNNKRVIPTETGEQIVALARKVLHQVDTMHDVAKSSKDPLAGKFRLGAFPTLSTYIFPTLVPKITASLPQLKLVLIEEKTQQLLERLKRGELDAALLALPIHDDQLEVRTLFDDEFLLATPATHTLAKQKQVTQNHISGEKLLLLEEGHCLRDQALAVCQLAGSEEEQDFRATSLETLRQMVKAGTGITFMPHIAIHPDERDICYIPFKKPAPHRTIGLVWRKTSVRRAVIEKILPLLLQQ
ncbi:MAG: LysR substrate-binding domain-containing protein [Pseudomonadales bacterium]|jgi:LysR family hydrogen peroxide-inducible transcriptional activator|nr:LysR substrate-binding domain-containing protein [Pseudomonadales bacterium]